MHPRSKPPKKATETSSISAGARLQSLNVLEDHALVTGLFGGGVVDMRDESGVVVQLSSCGCGE